MVLSRQSDRLAVDGQWPRVGGGFYTQDAARLARPVVCLCACLKVNSTHLVLLYSEGGRTETHDGCSVFFLFLPEASTLLLS
jgi:hypothetical protein